MRSSALKTNLEPLVVEPAGGPWTLSVADRACVRAKAVEGRLAFATLLLTLLGARSIAEKIGALLIAAAIAWLAGPRAATSQSAIAHFAGWTFAAAALAAYLHPRSE